MVLSCNKNLLLVEFVYLVVDLNFPACCSCLAADIILLFLLGGLLVYLVNFLRNVFVVVGHVKEIKVAKIIGFDYYFVGVTSLGIVFFVYICRLLC